MRAVICHEFGSIKDLILEDIASPPTAVDEVRIGVRASGVSFATGLIVAGKYQRKPPRPFVPGAEVAGEVLEILAAPACARLAEHERGPGRGIGLEAVMGLVDFEIVELTEKPTGSIHV